jgi:hypothetical protein
MDSSGAAVIVGEIVDGNEGTGAFDAGAPVPTVEPPGGGTFVADEGVALGAPLTCANAIAGRATPFERASESAPTSTPNSLATHSDRFATALVIDT